MTTTYVGKRGRRTRSAAIRGGGHEAGWKQTDHVRIVRRYARRRCGA